MTLSFVTALLFIFIIGFAVFYYLDSLNQKIEKITTESNRISRLTDEIRISAVSILKYQRKVTSKHNSVETVERLVSLCEGFTSQLQKLDNMYQDIEIKKVIAKMLGYVDSLKLFLLKADISQQKQIGLNSVGDLVDKILEAFSEFQDIQIYQSEEKDNILKSIIDETKRKMMYVLILTFMLSALVGLTIPGKVALPFKKLNDAIRELQDCNFDVSIYYDKDDEIGELANEMNKMILNFKVFEELRADRILVEGRKFDALATMVKKYILVANAKGELIYMNNQLYSLLQVQSEDVIYKNMKDTLIPKPIIETYELAIKRRSKIENAEIELVLQLDEDDKSNEFEEEDLQNIKVDGKVFKMAFQGFANVIPIRGKESSLDYYLMIMSEEMFS